MRMHIMILRILFVPTFCTAFKCNDKIQVLGRCFQAFTRQNAAYFHSVLLLLPSKDMSIETLEAELLKEMHTFDRPITFLRPRASNMPIISSYKSEVYVILNFEKQADLLFHSLSEQLHVLQHYASWNSRAKHILVINMYENLSVLLFQIFKKMWLLKIYNIVIMVPSVGIEQCKTKYLQHEEDKQNLNATIYTWLPYKNSSHCFDVQDVIQVGTYTESQCKSKHIPYLFPEKIPNDLQGCTLRVWLSPFPLFVTNSETITDRSNKTITIYTAGFDMKVIIALANILNITVVQHIEQDNVDNWTTALAEDLADVATGGLILGIINKHVEPSKVFFWDKIQWYVPCAIKLPQWKSIMQIFNISFWLTIFVLVSIYSFVMMCFTKHIRGNKKTVISVLDIWAVVLGMSVTKMPDSMPVRSVLFCWVLSATAMGTLFQTFFTTFLIEPLYGHQISQIDVLANSEMPTLINKYYSEFLRESADEISLKLLNKKLPYCSEYIECQKYIEANACTDTFATLWGEHPMQQFLQTFLVDNLTHKPLLCPVPNSILVTVNEVFYFPLGYHLSKHFNNVITHLMEAGIMNWWFQEQQHILLKNFSFPDKNGYMSLTKSHLQPAFNLLILGVGLAFITLLAEIAHGRFKGITAS